MAVTVVIAYDIRKDSTRASLAALLQAYGDRIQRSVFLLTVSSEELEKLKERIELLVDLEEDSVYVFRQCSLCWEGRECIGQAHPPEPTLFWAAL